MLMTEMYKTLNDTNPPFMQEYFMRKDVKYDLRTRDLLPIFAAKSITLGIDSIKFRGSLLWGSIPELIKRASSAAIFKRSIRNYCMPLLEQIRAATEAHPSLAHFEVHLDCPPQGVLERRITVGTCLLPLVTSLYVKHLFLLT